MILTSILLAMAIFWLMLGLVLVSRHRMGEITWAVLTAIVYNFELLAVGDFRQAYIWWLVFRMTPEKRQQMLATFERDEAQRRGAGTVAVRLRPTWPQWALVLACG